MVTTTKGGKVGRVSHGTANGSWSLAGMSHVDGIASSHFLDGRAKGRHAFTKPKNRVYIPRDPVEIGALSSTYWETS